MTIQEALAKHAEAMGDDVEPVLMVAHNGSVVIGSLGAPELRELVVTIYTDSGSRRLREYMWSNPSIVDIICAAKNAAARAGMAP